MKPGDAPVPHEEIVLLAAFLLSSGRRQVEETRDYAVYRLIEGARRALLLAESRGGTDPILESVRAQIDDIVHAPPAKLDFAPLLDDLCEQVANALNDSSPARKELQK